MAKDTFHQDLRLALEKDGWEITHDPYKLKDVKNCFVKFHCYHKVNAYSYHCTIFKVFFLIFCKKMTNDCGLGIADCGRWDTCSLLC
jgi:hypothetical protein